MAIKSGLVYWDSNLFLHYFENTPTYGDLLQQLIEETTREKRHIVTSLITKVEVAYVASERTKKSLDPEVEKAIDNFWADTSIIEFIELSDPITRYALKLIRDSLIQGWIGLKPNDAIHLASAQWVNADEVLTFERGQIWKRYSQWIGIDINPPSLKSPRLPGM